MNWIAALSAFVAVAAALHAWRTAARLRPESGSGSARYTGAGARGPVFSVAVLDGDIRIGLPDGVNQYALLLSIANGSPVPRTFTSIDLRIRYRTASNFTGVVEVPLSDVPDPGGWRTGEITLRLPLTVAPEQVLIGWAHFASGDVVPHDGRVDGYGVTIAGDTGERLIAEAAAITVRQSGRVSATRSA